MNTRTEQTVLAIILHRPEGFQQVSGILEAHDFSAEAHRLIYKAIQQLHTTAEPIDVVSVAEILDESGTLEAVGGRIYLLNLAMSALGTEDIAHHANLLTKGSPSGSRGR